MAAVYEVFEPIEAIALTPEDGRAAIPSSPTSHTAARQYEGDEG